MCYKILSILLLVCFITHARENVSRGFKNLEVKNAEGKELLTYGQSCALIIGVSDYNNGWRPLEGVGNDIAEVKKALSEQGFKVIEVLNPDSDQLEDAFKDFINEYGLDYNSRLIIYFAGHGHTEKLSYGTKEMGYIIPADAPNPNQDKSGFLRKALDMNQVEVFARRIQSKHALFLFDCCFAGSIFTAMRGIPEIISEKTSQPVRLFITAGKEDEPVPDKSIFCEQFVAALQGEGDMNQDGYMTGTELGEFLSSNVTNYSKGTQHPQYGKILDPSLDKGDFVFVLPEPEKEPVPEIPQAPDISNFSMDDLQAHAKWQEYTGKMRQAYQEVYQNFHLNSLISKDLKIKAWETFIATFGQDNPFSQKDDTLRTSANDYLLELTQSATRKAEPVKYGRLLIYAEPWAEVWLDGKYLGVTELIQEKVTAGKHTLEFKNPKFETIKKEVEVFEKDNPIRVSF